MNCAFLGVILFLATFTWVTTALSSSNFSCEGRLCPSGHVCCRFTNQDITMGVCAKTCHKHRCAINEDCASSDLYCKGKWCEYYIERDAVKHGRTCGLEDNDCRTDSRGNKTILYQYCCSHMCTKKPCSQEPQDPWVFVICIMVILVLVVAMVAFCWRISLYYHHVRTLENEDDSEGPFLNRYGVCCILIIHTSVSIVWYIQIS